MLEIIIKEIMKLGRKRKDFNIVNDDKQDFLNNVFFPTSWIDISIPKCILFNNNAFQLHTKLKVFPEIQLHCELVNNCWCITVDH